MSDFRDWFDEIIHCMGLALTPGFLDRIEAETFFRAREVLTRHKRQVVLADYTRKLRSQSMRVKRTLNPGFAKFAYPE